MNQEKSRKYLSEIDEWINEMDSIDLNNTNSGEDSGLDSSVKSLKSFSVEQDNISTSSNITRKLSTSSTKSTVSINEDKSSLVSNDLAKSFELVCTQIKSLFQMFEKRQEQLSKLAYPSTSKPVQRVEPQQTQSSQNEQNTSLSASNSPTSSSSSSSSSISINSAIPQHYIDINKFNSALIKRESMLKVN